CHSCSSVLTSTPAQAPALGVKTSGLAIAALVLGILSIFTLGLTAIPAIILGIISLVTIEKSGGRITGRGFAIAGIVTPVLGFLPLMAILLPALARAREQAKRAVCLNNLKQLSLAWVMYADENDDRIVNGAAGSERAGQLPWVGRDWSTDDQDEKREMLVNGALFPYCMTVKLYRCPAGLPGHMRTYSIVDSMNGIAEEGTDEIPGLHIKTRMEIRKPGYRVVFIDVGQVIPDTYSVYYDQQKWWDEPPVRHPDGTSVSFADGHAEYWKWRAAETVDHGKAATSVHSPKEADHWSPQTSEGREDLQRMQTGCWGRLGY
ncbi:MAG: DUF4190 domain-containing protein, partial [Desulfobacteraceae bacterium]|nr:DUF4190 domain-containing protein [Desulfobacteraceae bacterium]